MPYQTADAPFCLVVGWSFIGSGLIAWHQRPRNRLGPVMTLIGFAWFATFLTDARNPLLFTVGTAVQSLYLVGLGYLVLSFPSGRLPGWLERGVFWSALAVATVLPVTAMLVANSAAVLCPGCPANLLEVRRNDAIANGLLQAQRLAGAVLAVAVLILLVFRWRRASAAQRHSVAPVLWVGGVTLAALAVSSANDLAGDPFGQVPKQVLFVAVAALAVAVLVVLLQRRLARGAVAGLVVDLGRRETVSDLRGALARALGDPSVELAYWFEAGQRYVDGDGRPVQLPSARLKPGGDQGGKRQQAGGGADPRPGAAGESRAGGLGLRGGRADPGK